MRLLPGANGQSSRGGGRRRLSQDRKSTRLNSSHLVISYAVFCLKKKKRVRNGLCERGLGFYLGRCQSDGVRVVSCLHTCAGRVWRCWCGAWMTERHS